MTSLLDRSDLKPPRRPRPALTSATPLEEARDAVTAALMAWHRGTTNIRPVRVALERLERKAKNEAVGPLVNVIANAQLQAEGLVRIEMTKADMVKLGQAISDGLVEALKDASLQYNV